MHRNKFDEVRHTLCGIYDELIACKGDDSVILLESILSGYDSFFIDVHYSSDDSLDEILLDCTLSKISKKTLSSNYVSQEKMGYIHAILRAYLGLKNNKKSKTYNVLLHDQGRISVRIVCEHKINGFLGTDSMARLEINPYTNFRIPFFNK